MTKPVAALTIQTDNGLIEVFESNNPDFPGIYVDINGEQRLLIDTDGFISPSPVTLRVWEDPTDDYAYSQVIMKEGSV